MPTKWPAWWDWELELTSHIEKRMEDRGFTEVDLRAMLHGGKSFRPDVVAGRYVIATRHRRRPWEVIVEPDDDLELLAVVTAYEVDE